MVLRSFDVPVPTPIHEFRIVEESDWTEIMKRPLSIRIEYYHHPEKFQMEFPLLALCGHETGSLWVNEQMFHTMPMHEFVQWLGKHEQAWNQRDVGKACSNCAKH